jgi:hypothetical protein
MKDLVRKMEHWRRVGTTVMSNVFKGLPSFVRQRDHKYYIVCALLPSLLLLLSQIHEQTFSLRHVSSQGHHYSPPSVCLHNRSSSHIVPPTRFSAGPHVQWYPERLYTHLRASSPPIPRHPLCPSANRPKALAPGTELHILRQNLRQCNRTRVPPAASAQRLGLLRERRQHD